MNSLLAPVAFLPLLLVLPLIGALACLAVRQRPLRSGGTEQGLGTFRIPVWTGFDEDDLPPIPALEAAFKYLTLMVLAAVALVVAFVLLDRYRLEPEQDARLKLALGFLAVGLG